MENIPLIKFIRNCFARNYLKIPVQLRNGPWGLSQYKRARVSKRVQFISLLDVKLNRAETPGLLRKGIQNCKYN